MRLDSDHTVSCSAACPVFYSLPPASCLGFLFCFAIPHPWFQVPVCPSPSWSGCTWSLIVCRTCVSSLPTSPAYISPLRLVSPLVCCSSQLLSVPLSQSLIGFEPCLSLSPCLLAPRSLEPLSDCLRVNQPLLFVLATVEPCSALLPLAIEGCKGKLGSPICRNDECEWLFVSTRPSDKVATDAGSNPAPSLKTSGRSSSVGKCWKVDGDLSHELEGTQSPQKLFSRGFL